MNKAIVLAWCVLLVVCVSGCTGMSLYTEYRELDEIEPVQVIGLDFTDEIVTASLASGASMDGNPPIRMLSSANTVRRALADMQQFSAPKHVMFSHVQYYLIGEEAARSGMRRYVDYIERAMEVEQNTTIYVVRGGPAADAVINAGDDQTSVVDLLKSHSDDVKEAESCNTCSIMDITENLERNGCTLVGAIQLIEEPDIVTGTSKSTIASAGYAVIRGETLLSFIDKQNINGINIVTNQMGTDIVEADDTQGSMGAFRIIGTKTDVKSYFNGDKIERIDLNIKVKADIEELENEINLYDTDVIRGLEDNISGLVLKCTEAAVEGAQILKTDYLFIGEKIEIAHPVKFAKIKNEWHDIFGELNITVNITTDIERTYDIGDPMPRRQE